MKPLVCDPDFSPDAPSVLVVFLHGLGDNVMFTGPIREYHKLHPADRISLLVRDVGSAEVWRNNPHIHEVFASHSGHNPHYWNPAWYWVRDFWGVLGEIRSVRRHRHFDRIIHASVAPMPELFYRLFRCYGPHKTFRMARDLRIPLQNLGPELHLTWDTPRAEAFIGANGLSCYATLHPSSLCKGRSIGAESLPQIVEVLRTQKLQVVLVGRSDEFARLRLKHVVFAGDLPLDCLLPLIARAKVHVGTESGIAHVAALAAKRMVLLSTRSAAWRLTNCAPLSWAIPYLASGLAIEVVNLNGTGKQGADSLARVLENLALAPCRAA